jgi:hypothetical protein
MEFQSMVRVVMKVQLLMEHIIIARVIAQEWLIHMCLVDHQAIVGTAEEILRMKFVIQEKLGLLNMD